MYGVNNNRGNLQRVQHKGTIEQQHTKQSTFE